MALLALFSSSSIAMTGHGGHARQGVSFQINSVHVLLKLLPRSKPDAPKVSAEAVLTDGSSGSAVLDAQLYLRLEAPPTDGMSMDMAGDMPMEMPRDMQGGMSAGQMESEKEPAEMKGMEDSGGMELDFGEGPAMAAATKGLDLSAFVELHPTEKAGVFSAEFALPVKQAYGFSLAVKRVAGRSFEEPIVYGGTIPYPKIPQLLPPRLLFALAIILLTGIAAVLAAKYRSSLGLAPGVKANLLDVGWIRKLLSSPWYQPIFELPVLALFIVIVVVGLADVQTGDRNIATLLTWTIWWAGIIFTFVFAGRLWCVMCPFGAVQDWLGRRISFNADFPKMLRNIWLSTFLFIFLTWWNSYVGIVNKPAATSYLLLTFFGVSVVMALIFKRRAFCRYVCPIGGVIGLYSMFSPLELRNRSLEVCRGHKEKDCLKGTPKSLPCPMLESPLGIDRNNYCNFCCECVKACPRDNFVIRFRVFAKDLWTSTRGYMDEAFLALAMVGISLLATAEMVEPWHRWMDGFGKILPFGMLKWESHAVQEKAAFTIMLLAAIVIPFSLLAAASAIVKQSTDCPLGPSPRLGVRDIAVRFGYAFVPVGLSMHLAHNLAHLLAEGTKVAPALRRVLNKYAGANLGRPDWNPAPLLGPEALFWLQMLVFALLNGAALYACWRIAHKLYKEKAFRAFAPMALLIVFFMALNVFILGQPMNPRHTH